MEFWVFFIISVIIYISMILFARKLVSFGYRLILSRIVLSVIFSLVEVSLLLIAGFIQIDEAAGAALFFGAIGFIVSYGKGTDLLTSKFGPGTFKGIFGSTPEEKNNVLIAVIGIAMPMGLVILILMLYKLFQQ